MKSFEQTYRPSCINISFLTTIIFIISLSDFNFFSLKTFILNVLLIKKIEFREHL